MTFLAEDSGINCVRSTLIGSRVTGVQPARPIARPTLATSVTPPARPPVQPEHLFGIALPANLVVWHKGGSSAAAGASLEGVSVVRQYDRGAESRQGFGEPLGPFLGAIANEA